MKAVLIVVLLAACTGLALLGAVWLRAPARVSEAAPARAPAVGPAQEDGERLELARRVRERLDAPHVPAEALVSEEEEDRSEGAGSSDPLAGLWREPPVVDGPVIESFYPSGGPEFRGTQILNADDQWVRDGAWSAWHENGQVLERGDYADGVEDGEWRWWYEDGRPMALGHWLDGERDGPWTFWRENGNVLMVGSYSEGVAAGVWTLYHEDGYKQAHGPFDNGVFSGYWTIWNADGSVNADRTGLYADGQKVE